MDNYKLTGAYYPPSDYELAEGKAPKMKAKPCRCAAYKFPHRLDSGKCRELYNAPEQDDGLTMLERSRQAKNSAGYADYKRDEYR